MKEPSNRLKKIIYIKLREDLGETVVHPYGTDIWVLNKESKSWFLQIESKGDLWFNQKYFNNFFALFSMGSTQYSKILKEWVEVSLDLKLKTCSRKNTNYDYLIDGVISETTENYLWQGDKRFGFSHNTVKRYHTLKELSDGEDVKLKTYFSYLSKINTHPELSISTNRVII